MSASDTNVGINVNVNSTQLRGMFRQLQRLDQKIKSMSKGMTKAGGEMKRLGSKFDTASNKSKKFTKSLKSQTDKQKRAGSSLKNLTKNVRGYSSATDRSTKAMKKQKGSLGFTGLAFGFIGGIAGFALNRIKALGQGMLEVGVEDLGAMNRAIVQSGINLDKFLAGDKTEFNEFQDRIKGLQRGFSEFTLAEVGKGVERIVKALPDSASVQDIEQMSNALLTIQRIEGGDPAKIAVDLRRATVQFGIAGEDLDRFLDELVNVNQQSSIELNQLVSSLGFAGAQAQRFGLTTAETMAITGLLFDKGGRKAGAAGRTFSRVLEELTQTGTATNQILKSLGVNIELIDKKTGDRQECLSPDPD